MEEPGEQCIVVFALIVTEPASVCVFEEVGCAPPPPPPTVVTIYAKTTLLCSPGSSMHTVQYSIEDILAAAHYRVGNATCRPTRTPAGTGMTGLQLSTSVQVRLLFSFFVVVLESISITYADS
jgi:hypothetical protein